MLIFGQCFAQNEKSGDGQSVHFALRQKHRNTATYLNILLYTYVHLITLPNKQLYSDLPINFHAQHTTIA